MPLKQSLYDIAESRKRRILHKGFDYKGRLFERTMSHFLFAEEKRTQILTYLEDVVFELIERVKTIKNHVNYIVPKNYRDKN